MRIKKYLAKRRRDDRGASAVDYVLVIAIVGTVLVAAVAGFDWPMDDMVNRVGAMLGV